MCITSAHILVAFGVYRGNAAFVARMGLPESAESTSAPLVRCDPERTSAFSHRVILTNPKMPTCRCEGFVRLSAHAPRHHRQDGLSMTALSRFRAATQTWTSRTSSPHRKTSVGRFYLFRICWG